METAEHCGGWWEEVGDATRCSAKVELVQRSRFYEGAIGVVGVFLVLHCVDQVLLVELRKRCIHHIVR